MTKRPYILAFSLAVFAGLVACTPQTEESVARQDVVFAPVYQGVKTDLLEGDLVNFHVTMSGARDERDVHRYAECAAAQYALIRGFGFARHVRTTTQKSNEIWSGDAVYVISAALPKGLKTIDAEVIVDNCEDNSIPTV